jgi:hypothetical protein
LDEALEIEATSELQPPGVLSVRPLTPADIEPPKSNGKDLLKIRSIHHRVAAGLAVDETNVEISRATGLSPSTISTLKSNPAFQELVNHYQALHQEYVADLQSRSETTALRLLDELDERLEDDEKRAKIPFTTLSDTTMKMLDRAGQGPVSRSENKNVNINLSPSRLADIRKEAAALRFDPRQADPKLPPPDEPASESRRPHRGEAGTEGALGQSGEGKRVQSEGAGI